MTIIFSAVFILLVAGIVIFWQGYTQGNQLKSLKNQIFAVNKLAETEKAKQTNTAQASASLTQLEAAVKWANEEPLKSVPVLKDIDSLLLQRGLIQTIAYTEAGTVTLTAQFDTSQDAAYFYKTLLDSKWISEAKLSSLTVSELKQTKTIDSEQTTSDQSQYIPRYIGQYQITLNRDYINQEEKAEKDQQGGDAP